jgi:hypothetical protein
MSEKDPPGTTADDDKTPDPLRDRLGESAVLYAVLAVGYLALRLAFLSYGDPHVALTLAQHASVTALILSSVLTLLPMYFFPVAVVIFAQVHRRLRTQWQRSALSVLLLISIFASSLFVLAATLLGAVLLTKRRNDWVSRAFRWAFDKDGRINQAEILVVTSVFVFAPMYLPAEQIVVGSEKPVTAYVVGEGSEFTTLLIEDSRSIRIVKHDEVQSRTTCVTQRSWLFRPIFNVTRSKSGPSCP